MTNEEVKELLENIVLLLGFVVGTWNGQGLSQQLWAVDGRHGEKLTVGDILYTMAAPRDTLILILVCDINADPGKKNNIRYWLQFADTESIAERLKSSVYQLVS